MAALPVHVAEASYRPASEDRVAVIPHAGGTVIVVADGVGGRAGGGQAAEMLISVARAAVPTMPRIDDPRAWGRFLMTADRQLRDDPRAGGTTAVVVAITDRYLAGASVGDSGAFLIVPDAAFELTAGQRRKPFLGGGIAVPVEFRMKRRQGVLLAATDGLLKYASPETLWRIVREVPLEQAGAALIDAVRLPSGTLQDDVALTVCRVE